MCVYFAAEATVILRPFKFDIFMMVLSTNISNVDKVVGQKQLQAHIECQKCQK